MNPLTSSSPQMGYTSAPGEGGIMNFKDYDRKFSPHVVSSHFYLFIYLFIFYSCLYLAPSKRCHVFYKRFIQILRSDIMFLSMCPSEKYLSFFDVNSIISTGTKSLLKNWTCSVILNVQENNLSIGVVEI